MNEERIASFLFEIRSHKMPLYIKVPRANSGRIEEKNFIAVAKENATQKLKPGSERPAIMYEANAQISEF